MAFYDDQSLGYMDIDGGFGDFDYDYGNDFLSPTDGGYPGGIPGYDDYVIGEPAPVSGPVAPDVYDPYADEGPSQTNPDVVGIDNTVPDSGEIVITDDRPVQPDDIPDMGEIIIEGSTPRETQPDVVIDRLDFPDLELPDLTPYLPEEDVPEMEIVDTRPVKPVEEDIPEMEIVDTRPVEEDIPELEIVDTKPVVPEEVVDTLPIFVNPLNNFGPIDNIALADSFDASNKITLPTVVTPVTPVVPKQPSDGFLNPGMIDTTPFYKTTNDTQSKYYWGDRPLQYGAEFNPNTWNDVPNAPKTAWGVQEFGRPMSLQQAMGILQGTASYPELSPAEQAYLVMLDPQAQEQFLTRKGLVKKR